MTLFELDILYFLQEILKNDFLDSFMPKVTSLGNAGALWIGIAVVLLLFRKTRQTGLIMAAAMLLRQGGVSFRKAYAMDDNGMPEELRL